MRFTIQRIRSLVLTAGLLLVVVLAAFLTIDTWKNPFSRRDLPKRLGIDIEQEANGVTYTQSRGGHTIFKIHASKVIQLRNGHATLHDVRIELYGQNGNAVDRIAGNEFDYDRTTGVATAAGPVEIVLTAPKKAQTAPAAQTTPASAGGGEIHVETSGLIFNRQTGIASTDQRVEFSSEQGQGSAIGASYDSDRGLLILDRAVEMVDRRSPNPVRIDAQHAEFDRNAQVGRLRGADAETGNERAEAAEAQIVFRDDGSVERLDGSGGVGISTAAGDRLNAPRGSITFNAENQPSSGHFEGGVTLESASGGRQMSGRSDRMALEFNSIGKLRQAHLEGGVELRSLETGQAPARGRATPVHIARSWRSSVADLDFRAAAGGKIEPAKVHGSGEVVITSDTRTSAQPPTTARIAADELTGIFGPQTALTSLSGTGHASMEETSADGAVQTATGNSLQARFYPAAPVPGRTAPARATQTYPVPAAQIQFAELDGGVTLIQKPAQGAKPQPPLRATAGRAVYQAVDQSLHLTIDPRIEQGGMELSADRVDVSQASGGASAHGDVKATWIESVASGQAGSGPIAAPAGSPAVLGGSGPVHAVAAEAELHRATGKVTFLGRARLWQRDNSISAPILVISRQSQASNRTLIARTTDPAEPVIAILQSAGAGAPKGGRRNDSQAAAPSVIRVRGGDLWYSEAERKAVMRAAPLAAVVAESQGIEASSAQLDLLLAPPGQFKQAGQNANGAAGQVEQMTALGHVILTSPDRRGSGDKLVYTSSTGKYTLTGTASAPPRLSDAQHGSVTGAALIFNSRDDSVSIEGNGQETTTETTAPR